MSLRLTRCCAGILVISTVAAPVSAEETATTTEAAPVTEDPPPYLGEDAPPEVPSSNTRTGVILTGLLLTGAFYGVSLASSFAWKDWQGAPAARVPVVGPFFALGKVSCSYDNPDYDPNGPEDDTNLSVSMEPGCDTGDEVFRAILAGFSAVGQIGGLALLAEGLLMPTAEPVSSGAKSSGFSATALPVITPSTLGLSFTGTF